MSHVKGGGERETPNPVNLLVPSVETELEGRKHFQGSTQNNGTALGDVLNGDLIQLLRLKTMKRISHFVWLRKQFYQVHDPKCAETSLFLFSFQWVCYLEKMKGTVDDSSLSRERTIHGIKVLSAESGKILKKCELLSGLVC